MYEEFVSNIHLLAKTSNPEKAKGAFSDAFRVLLEDCFVYSVVKNDTADTDIAPVVLLVAVTLQ